MEEAETGTEPLECGQPQDWESTEEKWGGEESGKHKQGRRTENEDQRDGRPRGDFRTWRVCSPPPSPVKARARERAETTREKPEKKDRGNRT